MTGVRQDMEASTLDKQQKVVRSRWDWDRLEDHNTEWKLVIDSMNEKRGLPDPENSRGAKWYYMDIWNMALQRPDAHTQNLVDPAHENYDCLHCEPHIFANIFGECDPDQKLRRVCTKCGRTMDGVSWSPRSLGYMTTLQASSSQLNSCSCNPQYPLYLYLCRLRVSPGPAVVNAL